MPEADCPARREDAYLAARHPGWQPDEAFRAGLDAAGLIDAAARHVSGLRSLVIDNNLALTLWPVTRAVVEHIAHAGWLLDPEVTPEQRVARRWMAVLANACRYRWFLSAVGASKAEVKTAKLARERVRGELLDRFPGTNLDWSIEDDPNGPPWVVADQSYPGLGKSIRRFGQYAGLHNVAGLYELLSLHTHPNLHAGLVSSVQVVQHDTFIHFSYVGDVEQTIQLVRLASMYLYRAGAAMCGFFQLDPTELEAWADTAEMPASYDVP